MPVLGLSEDTVTDTALPLTWKPGTEPPTTLITRTKPADVGDPLMGGLQSLGMMTTTMPALMPLGPAV